MKRGRKLVIGFLTLGAVIGMGQYGPTHWTGCETYQGYRNNSADGETIYFFDEEDLYNRKVHPNHALSGNPGMYKNLEIGERYRLEIMEPRLPIFPKRLLSFENCGQNSN